MKSRWARAALILFFLALLAIPLMLRPDAAHLDNSGPDPSAALERYGFRLEEISSSAGIVFTHHAPQLDERVDHIMPMIASLGASVSIVDFDRDGWLDIYATRSRAGTSNALYHNLGDGKFEEIANQMGVGGDNSREAGTSMGGVWGDYDNDGYEDLFLYKWGRPELFHNERGARLERVTGTAGLPAWINANTAIWLDYDRDGYLDLFIGGYYPDSLDLWELSTTHIMPESFEYAGNGGRNFLLRNRGDGTFEDVTERVGLEGHRWTLAAAAADLRGNGYPDLVVANEYAVDELFFNQAGERFEAVGKSAGIGFAPKSGMNASFGDVLNTGALAIFISNISEPGVLLQGNNLWFPEGPGDELTFRNLAGAMGVELGGWSYGAQFGDLNNDGYLDLFLVNGFVSADRRASYWYDFSLVAGANRAIISDAVNWPAMKGRSLSGYQRSRVWLNDGAGRFQELAADVGVNQLHDGRAVVLADLWNRGALDVVVANQGGPLTVYRNTTRPDNAWIGFRLEGTRGNRSAIGASVEIFWRGERQLQVVSGGSGFAAQGPRRLHFGLGADARVEKAVIRWPSGVTQTLAAPEAGRLHTVREST